MSLGDVLILYRFLVLMLTCLWVVLVMWNLFAEQAASCEPNTPGAHESHNTLNEVAERVHQIAMQRRDEEGAQAVSLEDAAYFEKHCKQQTHLDVFKEALFWLLDIVTDLYTIVNFAAARSFAGYMFASLILGAGLLGFFRALLDGVFMKLGSAVRQTLKTGVRAEELHNLLELEVVIEVPVSLIMTTYGLPEGSHRPASAFMALLSIVLSLTRQAKWLYEEFDVCGGMDVYQTEKTPKHQMNAPTPEFFPKP